MNRMRQVLLLAISLSLTVAVSGFFGQSPSQASPLQKKRTGPVASRGTDAPSVESLDFLPRPFLKETPESYRIQTQIEAEMPSLPEPFTPVLAVKVDPKAEGTERDRQSQAAALISWHAELAQYVPAARQRHFAWIDPTSHFRIRGWQANILNTWKTEEGLGVRLWVCPVIGLSGSTCFSTVETYLISQGVVTPVGIELSDPGAPKILTDN